jgi:hypothetical protein
LGLAVVRDLREFRAPATAEELAGFETDVLALRQDRILHEALTVGADPLHLSLVFNLSLSTASRYADISQQLIADQPGFDASSR